MAWLDEQRVAAKRCPVCRAGTLQIVASKTLHVRRRLGGDRRYRVRQEISTRCSICRRMTLWINVEWAFLFPAMFSERDPWLY